MGKTQPAVFIWTNSFSGQWFRFFYVYIIYLAKKRFKIILQVCNFSYLFW